VENEIGAGGMVVSPGMMAGLVKTLSDSLYEGHRFQVASGWVRHYRPQTAREVIEQGLDYARSEDPDTPEGFFSAERFGARCDDR
jgi:hypothetical protein